MLEIQYTQVYGGPNLWTRVPSIRLIMDIGELEDRPTNMIPGFADTLTALIPSLHEHCCLEGRPGGFLERMRDGTWTGHVAEHVAIELQNLAGADVSRGMTRETDARGVYNVIYEYAQEDVGIAAGHLAVRLLNHLIYGVEPDFDFRRELEDKVIHLAEQLAYGPSTAAIVREAERRSIPVLRLDPRRSLAQLGHGCHQKRIWATITSNTSDMAVDIAANKELTTRLLRDIEIPVPRTVVVEDADEASREAARIGYPVVLKPLDGNHGRGVCINVQTEAEIRACYPIARGESRNGGVIVESYVIGKDYRILVVDHKVVTVAERVPAHVVSDGVHTVQQLVEIANNDPHRGDGHTVSSGDSRAGAGGADYHADHQLSTGRDGHRNVCGGCDRSIGRIRASLREPNGLVRMKGDDVNVRHRAQAHEALVIEGEQAADRGRLSVSPTTPTEVGTVTPPGPQPLGLASPRDALLYVPPTYQADVPAPLVVMLHGAGGNAYDGIAPFRALADAAGMILLAPDSRRRTWDVILGGYGADVEFIRRALAYVFARYLIDRRHIAIEGFSDGASYALSLGLTNGDLFTHVIAFSPGFAAPSVDPDSPRIFVSHGTQDAVLPIDVCSRRLVPVLLSAGYDLTYREFEGPHTVPVAIAREAQGWFCGLPQ